MTRSIRKQTKPLKNQESRKEKRDDHKAAAFKLLKSSQLSLRKIAATTILSKNVVGEIKELLHIEGAEAVQTQVIVTRMRSTRTILTEEEKSMIAQRLGYVASRGYAVDIYRIRRILGQVAAVGRRSRKHGVDF